MKKIFYCICTTAIVVVAVANVNLSLNREKGDTLLLMNVEALADDEGSHDGDCSKEGGECSVKLPKGSQIIITGMQKP